MRESTMEGKILPLREFVMSSLKDFALLLRDFALSSLRAWLMPRVAIHKQKNIVILRFSQETEVSQGVYSSLQADLKKTRGNPQCNIESIDCHDFATQNLAMTKSGVLDCHEFAIFVRVADSHNDALSLESIFS